MNPKYAHDPLYRKAMREGYRSRAVYKLREIQKRFHIVRGDDAVVDLGAAPGSWLQELVTITKGPVIGVDLNPIVPVEGASTIVGDFTSPAIRDEVLQRVREVNVVVCDAAPKLSGQQSYDQARSIGLGLDALGFATRTLRKGGNFLVKSFQGEDFPILLREVKIHFHAVHVYHTSASRKGSAEIYIIGKNFLGRDQFPEE